LSKENNRPEAGDDIDYERILIDQEYRREVMARLNATKLRETTLDDGSTAGE
jgi:hypothetical protein